MADSSQPNAAATAFPRISKENLFIIMALWMERCPLNGETSSQQPNPDSGQFGVSKAGAVFVNKNDRIVAMDCSRKRKDGVQVHAAARVLIKFPDKAKGCTVYMSRKPCSFCVKLLVQAEVSRIRFLPFQPEASPDTNCDDLENAKRTENLVRICPVGLSVYVPDLAKFEASDTDELVIDIEAEYWTKRWEQELKDIGEGSKRDIMRCSGLSDLVIDIVKDRMLEVGKWIGKATNKLKNNTTFGPFTESLRAESQKPESQKPESQKPKSQKPKLDGTLIVSSDHQPLPAFWLHMSKMSLIVSQRTDDPVEGVGVIIMTEEEVVSVGLSGYPSKALFGDFPRDNEPRRNREDRKKQSLARKEKYPFLIHAEQNALMITNTRVIPGSETITAFITKPPCEDCMCLLLEAGVSKIVLPLSKVKRKSIKLFLTSYEKSEVMAFGCVKKVQS